MHRPHQAPPPFVVLPTVTHTHSLILLHGLGSDGEKFGRELLETAKCSDGLTLAQLLPGAKFIFPTARRRRSTRFNRAMLTQWFDAGPLPDPAHHEQFDPTGLSESVPEILELLRQEHEDSGIPRQNILLGGLSQGCATSLSVLLCLDYSIGGFVGMSGYLPFRKELGIALDEPPHEDENPFSTDDSVPEPCDLTVRAFVFERDLLDLPVVDHPSLEKTAYSTPIFLGHGSADEKVPWALGRAMAGTMERAGFQVRWECYESLGHWYKIPNEIDDIVEFLVSSVGWKLGDS